ncbi:site-specific integrase [Bacteroides acidifaciens]|uniref:site-specific integrase n=1 Tax=Bacteroides acidifaciens TaxID=85831 RepID=UPI0025B6B243|nr:site-specific integrase [Bacteroides acidifaciens]
MARSTFKVLFYVNGSKEKDGIVPIMGRVTINGTVAQFSCKRNILKTLWDAKGNRAKGKSVEARNINHTLDNIKAQIIKHYQRISDREAYVTAEMVRNAYQGIGSEYETLLKAFDKENETFKKRVGKDRVLATYRARVRARNHVAAFIKSLYRRSDMSMLELTPDFIKEFAAYLSTEAGLQNGSIWANCMWLKGVVMKAHYNGLIPRNPFAQFHISPNVKEREYLTEDELKAVMTHEFADSKLAYIRDIFVFASFTALSFVDIQELTYDDIVEVNGEKWILSKRHKTKVPFQVKLLDIPLQIIERYRPQQENNLVFPNLNYWSVCKPLKKMIKECGITKSISFHCSRHGFATLALSKGMPIESVSRVLGHTNIVTTQLYAKITIQKIDDDLTKFGNKLNQSFNNISMG